MAFIVEDGFGYEDATSGASVEFANDYFTDRSVLTWTGSLVSKQSALIKATDYVELRFSSRFIGTIEFPLIPQALSFPRLVKNDLSKIVSLGVPVAYQKAICEYALRALSGTELLPDPVLGTSGQHLAAESHKTGPIEDSFRYQVKGPGAVVQLLRPYPSADMLLKDLVTRISGIYR